MHSEIKTKFSTNISLCNQWQAETEIRNKKPYKNSISCFAFCYFRTINYLQLASFNNIAIKKTYNRTYQPTNTKQLSSEKKISERRTISSCAIISSILYETERQEDKIVIADQLQTLYAFTLTLHEWVGNEVASYTKTIISVEGAIHSVRFKYFYLAWFIKNYLDCKHVYVEFMQRA